MLRFGFMDSNLAKPERRRFLLSFRKALEQNIDDLLQYEEANGSEMSINGRLAFQHGIRSYRSTLAWVNEILDQKSNDKLQEQRINQSQCRNPGVALKLLNQYRKTTNQKFVKVASVLI